MGKNRHPWLYFADLVRGAGSVALVGRSSCSSGLRSGDEIDACSLVLRFHGWTPRIPDQPDYGLRADAYIHSLKAGWEDMQQEGIDAVLCPLLEEDYGARRNLVPEVLQDRTAFCPPEIWEGVRGRIGGAWPSSGFVALCVLEHLAVVPRLIVAGMDFWASGKPYYLACSSDDTDGAIHNGAHDEVAEFREARKILAHCLRWYR